MLTLPPILLHAQLILNFSSTREVECSQYSILYYLFFSLSLFSQAGFICLGGLRTQPLSYVSHHVAVSMFVKFSGSYYWYIILF